MNKAGRPKIPFFVRFWSKVEMIPFHPCWEWTGSKTQGYGQITDEKRKNRLAHRVSYEIHNGIIPCGLYIDHLCRNRGCVNPNHLEAVTNAENIMRGVGVGVINSKKTHCVSGHEFSNKNTYRFDGVRHCRTCAIRRSNKFYKKKNILISASE